MNSPRRVILHAFSTFALGGAQARFITLVNSFGPRYRHLVIAMDNQWSAADRIAANVSWDRVEVVNKKGRGLANRAAFRAKLQQIQPDLVFSYNWGALEWAAANVPRVAPHWHVEDGFGPDEAVQQLARRVWTRRVILGLAGIRLIVPSQKLARLARGWWIRESHLAYIPNGVPVDAIAARKRPSRNGAPIVIGTVAGLRPEKNIGRLIRAFAQARQSHDIRLVIVGDGSDRAALEGLAKGLGVSGDVEFKGYMINPREQMQAFDLFALSSDTEQLPLAMLEAMSMGLPVVSTNVGDVASIVPPVAHACLSAADDQAFSTALLRVLAHQDDWPQWSDAGLSIVRQRFDETNMLERWRIIFDGLDAQPLCRPAAREEI